MSDNCSQLSRYHLTPGGWGVQWTFCGERLDECWRGWEERQSAEGVRMGRAGGLSVFASYVVGIAVRDMSDGKHRGEEE